MAEQQTILHGTCVRLPLPEGACGVLLRGPSGSGKSDLALRLLEDGAILVSDDQVVVRRENGLLLAEAPEPLRGLIEVYGLGVFRVGGGGPGEVNLVIDLVDPKDVERMPDPATEGILDVELPLFRLYAWEASAPAKLHAVARTVLEPSLLLE